MLRLGCQVSIAGKIYDALERASSLGCNTMQIFARNPRQWRKTVLEDEDIKIFKKKVKEKKIDPVVIHIPYTLNLASMKDSFYRITIREFAQDLIEADKLGADYLVTHMGSYKGGTERRGLSRITHALKKILDLTEGTKTMVLLENTAGSGSWLGYKFIHHNHIFDHLKWPERLGVCMDTAHLWAAGYKIDTAEGAEALVTELEQQVGVKRVKVIHLNDTQEKLDSRNDRHCDIGTGLIGREGFSALLNHPKLKNIPFILETPKETEEDDRRNLAVVRELYKK